MLPAWVAARAPRPLSASADAARLPVRKSRRLEVDLVIWSTPEMNAKGIISAATKHGQSTFPAWSSI